MGGEEEGEEWRGHCSAVRFARAEIGHLGDPASAVRNPVVLGNGPPPRPASATGGALPPPLPRPKAESTDVVTD